MGQTCILPMVAIGFPAMINSFLWLLLGFGFKFGFGLSLTLTPCLHHFYLTTSTLNGGHCSRNTDLNPTLNFGILLAFCSEVLTVQRQILYCLNSGGTFGLYAGVFSPFLAKGLFRKHCYCFWRGKGQVFFGYQ